jgi:hypothetical protein
MALIARMLSGICNLPHKPSIHLGQNLRSRFDLHHFSARLAVDIAHALLEKRV